MKRKALMMCVGWLVAFGIAPARADGELPAAVWTPVTAVAAPVGLATGGATCAVQSVRLEPQAPPVGDATQTISGTVVVQGASTCTTTESGIIQDTMLSLFEQTGQGTVDPSMLTATPAALKLLGTLHCAELDPTTSDNVCRSRAIAYRGGPNTRLIATNSTVYTLIDPRGGAWFSAGPLCEVSHRSFLQLSCTATATLNGG